MVATILVLFTPDNGLSWAIALFSLALIQRKGHYRDSTVSLHQMGGGQSKADNLKLLCDWLKILRPDWRQVAV